MEWNEQETGEFQIVALPRLKEPEDIECVGFAHRYVDEMAKHTLL